MFLKGYFRIHSCKSQVRTVIFTGTYRIIQNIVFFDQIFPSFRVFEYPFTESVFNKLLFLTCKESFIMIYHVFCFILFRIVNRIVNGSIDHVKTVLKNAVSGFSGRTVCSIRLDIILIKRLIHNIPFSSCRVMLNSYVIIVYSQITGKLRGFKKLIHKFLNVLIVYPGRTELSSNISCFDTVWHGGFKSGNVFSKIRIWFSCTLSNGKLVSDVSGKICVCGFPCRRFRI